MTDRVLRSDDPRCAELESQGWALVATSWGARLRVTPDLLRRLETVASAARGTGVEIRELTIEEAADVLRLDELTAADYPGGVATSHEPLDGAGARALFARGRVFGARYADTLLAVTVTEGGGPEGDGREGDGRRSRVETGFTAVHPDHRGRGLATAVKAASVLAHAAEGATLFGTGGSSANAASLAMNRSVGYEITETWHTYSPPGAP